MFGVALIVATLFFYKAYKLRLKHNEQIRRLEEENRRLRYEVEEWKARYESLLSSEKDRQSSSEEDPEMRIRRLTSRLEQRKTSLF